MTTVQVANARQWNSTGFGTESLRSLPITFTIVTSETNDDSMEKQAIQRWGYHSASQSYGNGSGLLKLISDGATGQRSSGRLNISNGMFIGFLLEFYS